MNRSLFSTVPAALACASMLFTAGCVNESYDGVPIDLLYQSDMKADFSVILEDGEEVRVSAFGIAIGFTRLHACPETQASVWQRVQDFVLPSAFAHSPSTPTSSGIPVVLSTRTHEADIIRGGLRPVRNERFCSVEIQLLNADDDAHLVDAMPEILGSASAANFNNLWHTSAAGPSRHIPLVPPLEASNEQRLEIRLSDELFQQELIELVAPATTADLGHALQDAALRALSAKVF